VTTGNWTTGVPTGVVGKPAMESVPVCRPNSGTGLHNRRGGAACTQNSDCTSEFCEATLKVCVELCSQDSTCPAGLTCDPVYMATSTATTAPITWGRACVNASFGELVRAITQ
jgi:hypothetical protein